MIEYKDIWYKDDGALTRVFCEESEYLRRCDAALKCTLKKDTAPLI